MLLFAQERDLVLIGEDGEYKVLLFSFLHHVNKKACK